MHAQPQKGCLYHWPVRKGKKREKPINVRNVRNGQEERVKVSQSRYRGFILKTLTFVKYFENVKYHELHEEGTTDAKTSDCYKQQKTDR